MSAPAAGLAPRHLERLARLPVVPLGAGTCVVSDLHLPSEAGEATDRFVAWALGREGLARLVCLGDLFDAWTGRAQLAMSGTAPVVDALARLAARGVRVDLLTGNRDTLLDGAFAERSGAALRPDGLVLEDERGARVLALHGDELCVGERGYLALRRVMRSTPMRALSRVAPLWLAAAVGRRMRARFAGGLRARDPSRGPQAGAASAAMRSAGAAWLLSGHTHDPRDVELAGEDGPPRRWITLGAFGEGRDELWLAPGPAALVRDALPPRAP